MIELRQHSRRSRSGHVKLWNDHVRQLQGCLKNMSEGGIYVECKPAQEISLGMLFEVKIIGDEWANDLPPLTMKAVRIDAQGIALQFYNLSFSFTHLASDGKVIVNCNCRKKGVGEGVRR